jgi:hypothetical protein
MRRIALLISVVGFLVLAGVGMVSGVPPFTCAWRALLGAGALFILAQVAGRYILSVLVDAWLRDGGTSNPVKDQSRGHGN